MIRGGAGGLGGGMYGMARAVYRIETQTKSIGWVKFTSKPRLTPFQGFSAQR